MAILPILEYPDPRLRKKAKPVVTVDDDIKRLVDDMFETMIDSHGIGLAASQVDVHQRVIVMDLTEDGSQPRVFINPEIEVLNDTTEPYDEGCLSIPGLYVEMLRPKLVLVEATNLEGNTIQIEADELLARLFQHEIDHLQGVLMFERMTPDQRKMAMAEYRRREEQPGESEATHLKLT